MVVVVAARTLRLNGYDSEVGRIASTYIKKPAKYTLREFILRADCHFTIACDPRSSPAARQPVEADDTDDTGRKSFGADSQSTFSSGRSYLDVRRLLSIRIPCRNDVQHDTTTASATPLPRPGCFRSSAIICTSPSSCIPLQQDSSGRQVSRSRMRMSGLPRSTRAASSSPISLPFCLLALCSSRTRSVRRIPSSRRLECTAPAPAPAARSSKFLVALRAALLFQISGALQPARPQGLISSILLQRERRESDRSLALLPRSPVSPRPSQDKAHSHFHQRPYQRQRQSFSHSSLVSDPSGLVCPAPSPPPTPLLHTFPSYRLASGRAALNSSHPTTTCSAASLDLAKATKRTIDSFDNQPKVNSRNWARAPIPLLSCLVSFQLLKSSKVKSGDLNWPAIGGYQQQR
ncbi:hypothetical protein CCHR01_15999 [Colletotrichum chrysophilum]|uniref:Uncharacterized protein n=1 Tax=Colletotrichum chrysophilum TaxID=1836956 RepID=A0AAD9EDZ8_9PEZI|nr:hypothetical protein CCHR01_15999 [Colletotrichum chrysophilum]